MSKVIYTLCVAALLTQVVSCGKLIYLEVPTHSDPALAPLEDFFRKRCKAEPVPAVFGDAPGTAVGFCVVTPIGRFVMLDTEQWPNLSDLGKEEVYLHEQGHCVMGRDHDDTYVYSPNTGFPIPATIMTPYAFGDTYDYVSNREYYLEELCGP